MQTYSLCLEELQFKFKRKIWTWTGIWASDLQISSLAHYHLSYLVSIDGTGLNFSLESNAMLYFVHDLCYIYSMDRTQLPLMEHSSGVRYISACNCGRKQGPREDPFTMKAANHDFYQLLGDECGCKHLESIPFPVFQPSTQDYKYINTLTYLCLELYK